MKLSIGIVGYSTEDFDTEKAEELLTKALNEVESEYDSAEEFEIVSGYTNLGIPSIAYNKAEERDWRTVGIACSKAKEFETYPVNTRVIVGDEWGDESEVFIEYIDILVKIGGGQQSENEVKLAHENDVDVITEYDTI